jgi:hypothetical protein
MQRCNDIIITISTLLRNWSDKKIKSKKPHTVYVKVGILLAWSYHFNKRGGLGP